MNIGYFSSTFPYTFSSQKYFCGGSCLATHSLVKTISQSEDVKVFTTSMDSRDHVERMGNLEIYRYATRINLITSPISFGLFSKPLKHEVDLLHVSFDMPPGPFAGLRYARKKDVPLVVTYHGDWDPDYGSFARKMGVKVNNKFVHSLLSRADVIISPSKTYAQNSKYLRDHLAKVRVIPNGIDLAEFQTKYSKEESREKLDLPTDDQIILFLGYLTPYKGPDILLRTFSQIVRSRPDTTLVFAGNGSMEEELKETAHKLGVKDQVIFAGFVEKEDRSLYYRSADVYCLPSFMSTECYPLAILEAMASQVPVVTSQIGGIPDIVEDQVNGLLVPPQDENRLKDTLITLLDDPEMCEKLSENAYQGIGKYSWDIIATETLKLYQELLDLK